MSWTTALDPVINQTITVKQWTGTSTDSYGVNTYGAASTFNARIVWGTNEGTEFAGATVTVRARALIASTSTKINATAQYTLPDGQVPNVISIREVAWIDGLTHHFVVSFGVGDNMQGSGGG